VSGNARQRRYTKRAIARWRAKPAPKGTSCCSCRHFNPQSQGGWSCTYTGRFDGGVSLYLEHQEHASAVGVSTYGAVCPGWNK